MTTCTPAICSCVHKYEGSGGDGEDIIAAAVQASSFEAMKEQASGRDSGAAQGHLRKGIVGESLLKQLIL